MRDIYLYRDPSVVVYQKVAGDSGPNFIAKFEPFSLHPVFFSGNNEEEARESALKWAADACAKYEQTYLNRVEAAKKARERKKNV